MATRKRLYSSSEALTMITDQPWTDSDNDTSVVAESEEDESSDIELHPDTSSLPSDAESETSSSESSSTGEVDSNEAILGNSQADTEQFRRSKTGIYWSSVPPPVARIRRHSIIHQQLCPVRNILHNCAISFDAFNHFMSDNIIEEIILCTNREARSNNRDWKNIDMIEMKAFFGLLLLAGVEKSWDQPIRELFLDGLSNPAYKSTMSVNRFESIRRFLRFDDKRSRGDRLQTDKLAAISYIWDLFIRNCRNNYSPGPNVTIDEQLLAFRGRCNFRQYMPKKPSKCGLKIYWLVDSKTHYSFNALIYCGRQPDGRVTVDLASNIVKQLATPLYNIGLNITLDNYFTSYNLATYLLERNTTIVGTIRQNRKELPPIMKPNKGKEVFSSTFVYKDDITLVSYGSKRGKAVVLLSSIHHSASISETTKHKPEIITYYNATKAGVDTVDQMVSCYTSKRQTKRWPFVIFHNILDICALNAYIVFVAANPQWNIHKTHKRRLFLKDLSLNLIYPQQLRRSGNPFLNKSHRSALQAFGIEHLPIQPPTAPQNAKRRCYICPNSIGRKSQRCCSNCHHHVCKEHSREVIKCVNCQNV